MIQLDQPPYDVHCSKCRAQQRQRCRDYAGNPTAPHHSRVEASKERTYAPVDRR